MKKIYFLALVITVISVTNSQAQQGFTDLFDSAFVNINRTEATTGILYDRVIPFANLTKFSGINPSVNQKFLLTTDSLKKRV